MTQITIDIINEKAIHLLKDLENLDLIRMHKASKSDKGSINQLKGKMTKQPLSDIEAQLNQLRSEWE